MRAHPLQTSRSYGASQTTSKGCLKNESLFLRLGRRAGLLDGAATVGPRIKPARRACRARESRGRGRGRAERGVSELLAPGGRVAAGAADLPAEGRRRGREVRERGATAARVRGHAHLRPLRRRQHHRARGLPRLLRGAARRLPPLRGLGRHVLPPGIRRGEAGARRARHRPRTQAEERPRLPRRPRADGPGAGRD